MKKITNNVLLILLLSLSTTASALDVSELDITVGGKAWFSSMKFKGAGGSIKSDNSSLMAGPSIIVKKDKFFAGGSYLLSLNDYEFKGNNNTLTVSRKDLDLIGGYAINPNISLYGGYKYTKLGADVDATQKGFGFGIMGNKAVYDKVVLFGSFGLLKQNEDFTGGSDKLFGTVIEFGAAMPIKTNLSASVSYKTQNLKYDSDNVKLVYSGLAATINYTL